MKLVGDKKYGAAPSTSSACYGAKRGDLFGGTFAGLRVAWPELESDSNIDIRLEQETECRAVDARGVKTVVRDMGISITRRRRCRGTEGRST